LIVQLSDIHVREDDPGPAERLRSALRSVSALLPRPDALLLSGDLVDLPSPGAYAQVRSMVEEMGLPVHALPGNHDDRELLRGAFPSPDAEPGAPVCFATRCGEIRLVGLDSTDPGNDAGALGQDRLRWLERTLAEDRGTPTLLALHHPPVLTGVERMDAIALARLDREALESLLSEHPQVGAVTCGHVHTTMTTGYAGRTLLVCPAVNSTLALDLRADAELSFHTAGPLRGYAVHALVGGRIVSHVQAVP
jgi:3',5'-cyclic-AMP phosphodiesterase